MGGGGGKVGIGVGGGKVGMGVGGGKVGSELFRDTPS